MRVAAALVSIFLSCTSMAQDLSISGKVMDQKEQQPLSFVGISLHKEGDSSMVSGSLTDSAGEYTMAGLSPGSYLVRASFVGYDEVWSEPVRLKVRSVQMPDIFLSTNAAGLDEVVVEGKKSIVEIGIDRKAYDVQETMATPGGSAINVLEQIPSVSVDQDGNLSLRGSGNVTVLINGRPSVASGASLGAVLEGIPASSVQRIEVIPNPSAKYDPDGMSGIINIVLKKDARKGTTVYTQLSAANSHNYSGSISVDHRKDKWVLNTNYNVRHYQGYRNFEQDRYTFFGDTTVYLKQRREGTDFNHTQLLGLGFENQVTPDHVWGMSGSANYNRRLRKGYLVNTESDGGDQVYRNWTRDTEDPRDRWRMEMGAFYQGKWKSGHKLNLDISQSYNFSRSEAYYDETYFDPDWALTDESPLVEEQYGKDREWVTAAQADHSWIISDKLKFESGLKSIVRSIGREFEAFSFDHSSDVFERNDSLTADYIYQEQIHAAYVTFSQGFDKGFGYMVGLRGEMAFTDFDVNTINEAFSNDYYSLFPSLHLSQKIGKKQELSLSYSRRVNRPSVHSLNPVARYTDPLNLRVGNPYLTPEYINSVELGYSFFNKKVTLSPSVYFKHMQDMLTRIKTVDSTGVATLTWENLDQGMNMGAEMVAIVKPFKWWNMMLSGNAYYTQLFGDEQNGSDLNNQGFSWSVKYNSTWTMWKDLDLTVSGNYSGYRITAQGRILPRYSTDIWLKKGFLGGRGSIGFRVEDIFNTKAFQIELDDGFYLQDLTYKWQSRRFHITFSLRFGDAVEKSRKGNPSLGGGGDSGF